MFNTSKLKYKFIADDAKHKQFILQNEDKSKDAPKKLLNQKVLIDIKQNVEINGTQIQYIVRIDNDSIQCTIDTQNMKELAHICFNAQ